MPEMHEDFENAVYCDLELRPSRSMTFLGKAVLFGALALAATLVTIFSAKAGALPVGVIFDAAAAGLAGAIYANSRSGREYQTVRLTGKALEVRHVKPGGTVKTLADWPPYMIDVEVTERAESPEKILLRSRGREVEIGGFLPPAEKPEVAQELKKALAAMAGPR